MANMNLTVNMENLTEEERSQLLALIEKSTEEKSKVWKPKNNESFYIINQNGDVDYVAGLSNSTFAISYNEYLTSRQNKYSIGNCFPTKEKAEFAVERLKVIAELKRFAQEHNKEEIDWRDFGQCKYYIYCEFHDNAEYIDIGCVKECKSNDIYFTSKEIAQQAIEAIGEDRIKKYYFEVED